MTDIFALRYETGLVFYKYRHSDGWNLIPACCVTRSSGEGLIYR